MLGPNLSRSLCKAAVLDRQAYTKDLHFFGPLENDRELVDRSCARGSAFRSKGDLISTTWGEQL